MLVSFVIPYFNSILTIDAALKSIFNGDCHADNYEIIIVDDGSSSPLSYHNINFDNSKINIIRHDSNKGMCAARNTGILNAMGKYIAILDSDDELVCNWFSVFTRIVKEWPEDANICFAASVNDDCKIAASEPEFNGYQYLSDVLNERRSGEYLPIFKSSYVKNILYSDLKISRSCGLFSYIKFTIDSPIWISSTVMRIYHDAQLNSVTSNWTSSKKSYESAFCIMKVLDSYSDLYLKLAPSKYYELYLKLSVYQKYAAMAGWWVSWKIGANIKSPIKSLLSLLMIILGKKFGNYLRYFSKKFRYIKPYG